MEQPSGVTKKKQHVLYLKALGLAHKGIERIARTSSDSVTRCLKDYKAGRLAAFGLLHTHCPASALQPCQDQIKSHFLKQPPHTVVEASHEIEVLTVIKPRPSACRDFMRKRLGMKFRKMVDIPAKADPKKQAEFLNEPLEPLLEEQQGKRKTFVEVAHFVMGAFLGMLWCSERLFLKSSIWRRRYNVQSAFSLKGTDLVTVTNDSCIISYTIVDLLFKIKQEYADIPLTLIMDNARNQRCNKVTEQAKATGSTSFSVPLLPQFELFPPNLEPLPPGLLHTNCFNALRLSMCC